MRISLAVLAMSFLFALVGRGIAESLTVFILPFENEFEGSRAAATSIFAAVTLASGLSGPWVGTVSDRLGSRVFYLCAFILLTGGCFLASLSTSPWQLAIVLGLGLGLSSACLGMAGQTTIIRRWFPGRTGTAIGVVGSATGLGVLVFAPLAELLIQASGWRSTYQAFAAIAATLAIVVLLLPWRRIEAGVGGVEGSGQRPAPVSWSTLLVDASLWGIFAGYFLTSLAILMIQPQLVAYFVHVGYEPLAAATWVGVGGIATCIGMIGFGWLGDRIGMPTALAISYASTAVGVAVLVLMMESAAVWLMPLYVATFASTLGSRSPLVLAMVSKRWPPGAVGRVAGIILAAIGFGGGLGAWLGGALHDNWGYQTMFGVSAVTLTLAAFAWWLTLRGMQPAGVSTFSARSLDTADAE